MRPRLRARRGRRILLLLLLVALALPAWFVVQSLAQGRDLAAAWRAFRAPAPELAAAPVALPPAPFGPALFVGSLLDPELVEISGLAGSRRGADVLWAVNDAGNPTRLHALSSEGRLLRSLDVEVGEAAADADWEDLASFRFEGAPYLLIADVGDNQSWRPHVSLLVVAEPDLTAAQAAQLTPHARIELRYADGPRDCEAVAVEEETGTLLLISKRTAPPELYAAELAPLLRAGRGGELVARKLGPVAIPPPTTEYADALVPPMLHMPTALDLEPGGAAAFVLGYAAGWRFPRAPGESWAEAFARAPEQLALPPLALAEAAAYHAGSLFVTSEVDRLALVRWRAPLVRFDPR